MILVKGLPAGVSGERVAATVARIAAAGRAAWPTVSLTEDVIFEYAGGARLRDDPEAHLEELRDADPFLAFGLKTGDTAALKAFEEDPGPAD